MDDFLSTDDPKHVEPAEGIERHQAPRGAWDLHSAWFGNTERLIHRESADVIDVNQSYFTPDVHSFSQVATPFKTGFAADHFSCNWME
jgi:hypothetical protein